jgi:sialate O-acetylesterase
MRGVLLLSILFASTACADVSVPSLFADHMVLQRESSVPVWGKADPGERIAVEGSWGARASAIAGTDGKWMARLRTGKAGGPHTLAVQGKNRQTFSDVMLGEVWLLSGQSNMEWTVGQVIDKAPPGRGAGDPSLPLVRLFQVPNKRSRMPLESVDARWRVCDAESAKGFSAVGYFFARHLVGEIKIPIGLLQADWGGTEVEVWIRESALKELPGFSSRVEEVLAAWLAYQPMDSAAWRQKVTELEKGMGSYEKPEYDDLGWKAIEGPQPWDAEGLGAFDGYAWYRARFELMMDDLSGPAVLELGAIDDEDETFVNGAKVGETRAYNARRRYEVPPSALRVGANVLAVRVLDTQMGGGFSNPGDIRLTVGGKTVALKGWRTIRSAGTVEVPRPREPRWPAGDLYNGMIAPLIPYAISGALWYQGESNVSRAHQYRQTFPHLIRTWRRDWGQGDFPFYYAQIAPFSGYGGSAASAELREAQMMALKLPHTAMVVTTDLTDDVKDIHPVNKWDVGRRFALLALNRVYGRKQVDSGPIYKGFKVEGAAIRIFFEPSESRLVMDAFSLPGLEIAGEDRKFVIAQARVDGNTLVVHSPEVQKPVAVRYGWSDAPKPGLFNEAGLPASPFRTDSWPGVTEKEGW